MSRALRIAPLFLMAMFAVEVFAAPVIAQAYTVSVQTDKPSYAGVAQIMISGTVLPATGPNSAAIVSALNPNNATMDFEGAAVYPSTGSFSQIRVASGPISCGGSMCWTAGKYVVDMMWGGAGRTATAVTIFQYSPGLGSGTTTTSVACSTPSIAVNAIAQCTATVSGTSGTISGEMIAFSATGAGAVVLPSPAACIISGSSCSVSVRGAALGSVMIQASYLGDSSNAASSGTASLAVAQGVTSVSVTCTPGTVGVTSTCIATVSGAADVISRELITFVQTGGTGSVSFVLPQSPASCTMAEAAACSIAVMGDTPGSVTIKASYGGDADDAASSGTTTFTVAQTASSTTSTASSSTVSSTTSSTSTNSHSSSSGGSGSSTVYIFVAAIVVIVVAIGVFMRRRVARS